MKAVARSYFWWIGLDEDIETLGKSYEEYQAVKSNPAAAPLPRGYGQTRHGPVSV